MAQHAAARAPAQSAPPSAVCILREGAPIAIPLLQRFGLRVNVSASCTPVGRDARGTAAACTLLWLELMSHPQRLCGHERCRSHPYNIVGPRT